MPISASIIKGVKKKIRQYQGTLTLYFLKYHRILVQSVTHIFRRQKISGPSHLAFMKEERGKHQVASEATFTPTFTFTVQSANTIQLGG